MALHTPLQMPEGPVPDQIPLPRDRLNRPVPRATRGPATAFILACPEPDTWPANRMGWKTNDPPVELPAPLDRRRGVPIGEGSQ
jgi:hypothetical protein